MRVHADLAQRVGQHGPRAASVKIMPFALAVRAAPVVDVVAMPITMSCDGLMIGLPLAGLKMLLVDIISMWASTWASIDSGRCTAIWSPSKSALKPLQTSGWMLDGVAFDQHRLEGLDAHAVQRRGAVEQHRVVVDHLFEDVPDLLVLALEHLLGALDGVGVAAAP